MTLRSILATTATIVIIAAFGFSTAVSQGHRKDRGYKKRPSLEQMMKMVDDMKEEIKLTDEQTEKIKSLTEEHFEAVKKRHEECEGDPDKMKALRDETRDDYENAIKAELTDEQIEKFEEFWKDHTRRAERSWRNRK